VPDDDGFRRYIDAGISLTQITRARAEELVRELVQSGEVESSNAQDRVDDLLRRSREASEELVTFIRDQVRVQLRDLGFTDLDDFTHRVADMLVDLPRSAREAAESGARHAQRVGESTVARATGVKARRRGGEVPTTRAGSRSATTTSSAPRAAARKSTAKKSAAKKSPSKKAPAKKAAAKKSTAKKSTAKKSTAKKSTAKKTVAKKSTAAKAARRKTPAKKPPATRSASRPGASGTR
jgi:polyhydroxyalkanoate synthesis regulator phasin